MNAALALVFLACVTGSMAADARTQVFGQLVQQGQAVAQTVLAQLQQQLIQLVQQAVGQLSTLVNSMGRLSIDFNSVLIQFKPIVTDLVTQVLVQVAGGLEGLLGGRQLLNIDAIFDGLIVDLVGLLSAIGQEFLNHDLLTSLAGTIGGSRGINDIFASLSQQVAAAVAAAQGALSGTLTNLTALGSGIIDASKPHLAQLQEQLVGHGLNVLGSLSETINNLHGSITGGR